MVKFFSRKPFQVVYFESRRMHSLMRDLVSRMNFDVIHTQHLRMAQYTVHVEGIPRVLDLPDAYSLYWARRTEIANNLFMKIFNRIEYRRVVNYEGIVCDFDLNLVCSPEDMQFLVEKHGHLSIDILANGVDLDAFREKDHDYQSKESIIFTGNMDYFPNIDAAVYLVREIIPLVRRRFSDVKCYIAGQNPVKKVRTLHGNGVIVTGFVADLGELYNQCDIAVSPIRYGAGTLNKVLEPMALGIPVVSSIVGFTGLGVQSGEGVILAETKEAFAGSICDLLQDIDLRKKVGLAGKKVLFENFGWQKIGEKLEEYLSRVSYSSKNVL